MVEQSTNMASIANEQLIYLFRAKLAIRCNNCQSYRLTTCTQCVPIFWFVKQLQVQDFYAGFQWKEVRFDQSSWKDIFLINTYWQYLLTRSGTAYQIRRWFVAWCCPTPRKAVRRYCQYVLITSRPRSCPSSPKYFEQCPKWRRFWLWSNHII
jgi:hypothetical protein